MANKMFVGEIRIMGRMCFAAFLRFLIPGLVLTALLLAVSLMEDGQTAHFLRLLSPVPFLVLGIAGLVYVAEKTLQFFGKRAKARAS